MNNDINSLVLKNTNDLKTLYNQRKAVVARQYGEEHDAIGANGISVFYLCHDVDTEYVAEFKFKLVITGQGQSQAGGHYVSSDYGKNTYANYASWVIAFPEGSAVDTDGWWGAQCWDYANAFWRAQVGRTLLTGPEHSAYECWTFNRAANAGTEFETFNDKTKIKQGDWLVFSYGKAGTSPYGHIAMAAEDYNNADSIQCYGQNQGGYNMPKGGQAVNIATLKLNNFIGAFRYKRWH